MLEHIETNLAILIDNTCWTLASTLELMKRARSAADSGTAALRRLIESDILVGLYVKHREAVQADAFRRARKEIERSAGDA